MSEPMAYVARAACGCYYAAVVDLPDYSADTAQTVARWIREGGVVAHVTVETARRVVRSCPHAPKWGLPVSDAQIPGQETLFAEPVPTGEEQQ